MPIDLSQQSIAALFAIAGVAGAIVWFAGTRLAGLVDEIAQRTGIGQAFAGMLLLGGITSLPEVATVATASAAGNPILAVNNLLGSAAINVLLLAIGDLRYGKAALTSMAARPVTLMQGVLGMILLAAVAIAAASGDWGIPGLGFGIMTVVLGLASVQALRVVARFQNSHVWEAVDPPHADRREGRSIDRSTPALVGLIVFAAAGILFAGAALSLAGDAIAQKTGIGDSLVGFALVGLGTSLPELSSVFAALRLRRYELAIGDIFGTNLFNIQLLLLADVVYGAGPVLSLAGRFEIAAASLGAVMTGIFVVGLLERRDRTIWRIGEDSALALCAFGAGLFALSRLS